MRRNSREVLRFESKPKWYIPVVQQRTRQWRKDAARAVPPSEAKIKIPVQRVQNKNEILQSTACTRNDADQKSRRMKLKKTFGEQGKLSVRAVVRIVNEAASDQECSGDAGGSRTPQKAETISILASGKQPDRDSVEQHPSVQDPGAQASTAAEAHKRSTSMSPTVPTKTAKDQRSERLQQIRS